MLKPDQIRPLLSALYGLTAAVAVMVLLVVVLAWQLPNETPMVATKAPAGETTAGGSAPKPVAMSADALAGKEIFNGNCAACHSPGADKLVGPGLKGVRQRTPGEEWLQKWIRNSSALIATGDAYANKVFNENGKVQMSSFTSLSDQQIKQVLDYVDANN